MHNLVGYARVSTVDQDLDGQIEKLTAAGCKRIYSEKLSGAKADNRPELVALLASLQSGDTLIVTRLDRLARSTVDLLTVLDSVQARGATFKSLTETWADLTTPQGKLILTIMGAFATWERELIKARCNEGRARARAAGKRLGGPRTRKLDDGQRDNIIGLRRLGRSLTDIAADFGVSRDTVKRVCG